MNGYNTHEHNMDDKAVGKEAAQVHVYKVRNGHTNTRTCFIQRLIVQLENYNF